MNPISTDDYATSLYHASRGSDIEAARDAAAKLEELAHQVADDQVCRYEGDWPLLQGYTHQAIGARITTWFPGVESLTSWVHRLIRRQLDAPEFKAVRVNHTRQSLQDAVTAIEGLQDALGEIDRLFAHDDRWDGRHSDINSKHVLDAVRTLRDEVGVKADNTLRRLDAALTVLQPREVGIDE